MPRSTLIANALPEPAKAPAAEFWATLSAFTVEGEDAIASYNAEAGTIETFEGEQFALNNLSSVTGGLSGEDLPSNVHYRCDQFWNCTLVLGGQLVPNVKRTR
jgi:hypothetical protein